MAELRPLHRIFGLSWMDFFEGTSVQVVTEMDLSVKQQFVDVILIRTDSQNIPRKLPDGFEELAVYNLVTFKSYHEPLDSWALWELTSHFVNYRKQSSPSLHELLPEDQYRLFAVCARFPNGLDQQGFLTPVREGIYDAWMLNLRIRIIVIGQLPQEEHNAMLLLFSAQERLLRYGQRHYRPYCSETSTLLRLLLNVYDEDPNMPDQLKEAVRQTINEILKSLPTKERLKGLSTEERLEGLPPEERLKGLPPEERLKGMSAQEMLLALSPEMREQLFQGLKSNDSSKHE